MTDIDLKTRVENLECELVDLKNFSCGVVRKMASFQVEILSLLIENNCLDTDVKNRCIIGVKQINDFLIECEALEFGCLDFDGLI